MRKTMLTMAVISAFMTYGTLNVPAKAQNADLDNVLEQMGAETIRDVKPDIAFPANSDEYEILGKNAILRVEASSVVASELPLRSVYAEMMGVRIPLQRILSADRAYNARSEKTSQVSFYIVPVQVVKKKFRLAADFSGSRKDFGFMSYDEGEAVEGAPAFIRLDEYDNPSEPDMKAVHHLLLREYPGDF